MKKQIKCWVITEGLAGTQNQCVGVAEAMNITPQIFQIQLAFPWNILSPYLGFECAATFTSRLSCPPYPDLLITSGRKAIAAARYIKRKSGGRTFTVHIQDPRINPKAFDLVALPAHDPTRGDNVIVTAAAPNRITKPRLSTAQEGFSHLKRLSPSVPHVAVLIGGDSKVYRLTPQIMTHLASQLRALQISGDAHLMITTSRRTGAANEKILHDALRGTGAYIWDGAGDNPYFALLGYADYIMVTADSTSMLSEAATTGKPVYRIDLPPIGKPYRRIALMHKNLENTGAVRVFNGSLEPPWTYTPLNDAQMVAAAIKAHIQNNHFD